MVLNPKPSSWVVMLRGVLGLRSTVHLKFIDYEVYGDLIIILGSFIFYLPKAFAMFSRTAAKRALETESRPDYSVFHQGRTLHERELRGASGQLCRCSDKLEGFLNPSGSVPGSSLYP